MICSNFGRRSDKNERRKEFLARRHLELKYRVRLFYKRKGRKDDPCHAVRRHGAQNNLDTILDRITRTKGKAGKRRIPKGPFSSRFESEGKMWYAREQFLMAHKTEMDRIAKAIDEKQPVETHIFDACFDLPQTVGEGYVKQNKITGAPGTGVEYVGAISQVYFKYQYVDGMWYEVTGYPHAVNQFRRTHGLK